MTKQITYTMLSTFLSCRQKYDYRYNRAIVPEEYPTSLAFGSAVHAGLEAWFRYNDCEIALSMAKSVELSDTDQEKVYALITAYCDKYCFEEFKVKAVEFEFLTPLTNPRTHRKSRNWELAGKVDGVVEKDDKIYILEHKTASKPDEAYFDRVEIDMQIAFYAIAIEQELHRPVAGALYDVLVKPAIRLKTNESIQQFSERLRETIDESYFIRRYIEFDADFINTRHTQIWDICKELNKATICPNTSNCLNFGTPCPYLPLCRARGNLNNLTGFTMRKPHEELSNV